MNYTMYMEYKLTTDMAALADRTVAEVMQTLDNALAIAAQAAVAEAKATVPVRTGLLQSQIGAEPVSPHEWDFYAKTHYATFVEFGTRFMAAQPYMRYGIMKMLEVFRTLGR